MKVSEIREILDNWMPISIAEDFDNVGLIVGDRFFHPFNFSLIMFFLGGNVPAFEPPLIVGCSRSRIILKIPQLLKCPSLKGGPAQESCSTCPQLLK